MRLILIWSPKPKYDTYSYKLKIRINEHKTFRLDVSVIFVFIKQAPGVISVWFFDTSAAGLAHALACDGSLPFRPGRILSSFFLYKLSFSNEKNKFLMWFDVSFFPILSLWFLIEFFWEKNLILRWILVSSCGVLLTAL